MTGVQTCALPIYTKDVNCLTFSSDGTSLVSGSQDSSVKLWDLQTGGVVKTFSGHTDAVLSVSISPDLATIASGSPDKTICLWNIQTEECYQTIQQQDIVYNVTVGNEQNSVLDYLWNMRLLGCIFQAFPELVNTL